MKTTLLRMPIERLQEQDERVMVSIRATREEIRAAYAMAEALQTTVVFIMGEAHK